MSASKSLILNSIRHSLAGARHLPSAPRVSLPTPEPTTNTQLLLDQFASELQKLSGTFLSARSEQVPALVAQLLRERQAESLLAWQAESLPVPGLIDFLRREGFIVPGTAIPVEPGLRAARVQEIERVTVGLTGVDAVLADTGTIALRSGPGRLRLASLSVNTHIALFTPKQIYASWADWWHQIAGRAEWVSAASRSSSVTLISGPSRTADIEMTLTTGVHGPGEVITVLVE
jgi:L-lactate dehydrogenase complex protein LldG